VAVNNGTTFEVPARGGMDMGVNVEVTVGVGVGPKDVHPL
jgi:hypothetical protein